MSAGRARAEGQTDEADPRCKHNKIERGNTQQGESNKRTRRATGEEERKHKTSDKLQARGSKTTKVYHILDRRSFD